MATGHLNPGYGNVVSRLGRSRSAHPGCLHQGQTLRDMQHNGVDDNTLQQIKDTARYLWSCPDDDRTTYGREYKNKTGAINESLQPASRPESRRNNPHPSLTFLSSRLHYVPGFFNPDATLGKEPYKVDAAASPYDLSQRQNMKLKYSTRPNTAAIMQHETYPELQVIENPWERQATEAWLKLANDQGREEVGGALVEKYLQQQRNGSADCAAFIPPSPPGPASIHRINKMAGAYETDAVSGWAHYGNTAPRRPTVSALRHRDIDNARRFAYTHRSKRGDFLLHPEWPPSIPHHRLNGLSSVDIPYGVGRR